ncbi:hypothetical protein EDB80DRAFT_633763 [Ilyonectria destructans]|nr:hypothetical protein EDB80DRAFT_633763 [Ilyonectria destructans]
MSTIDANPVKWTRAKAPRVRTGCKTWYVKLLRCGKDGYTCDGYELLSARKPRAKKHILPAQQSKILTIRRKEPPSPLISSAPELNADISQLPTEIDLFYHFRTCILQDLETASTPTDFWYFHVLPLAHAVEPIKYAIFALGGVHKSFKSQSIGSLAGTLAIRDLERVSIEQYNQAIHHLKAYSQLSNLNTETILTCCIIFICIETLLGRYVEALRHLQSGCALLTSLQELSYDDTGLTPRQDRQEKTRFFDNIVAMFSKLGQDITSYVGFNVIPQLYYYVNTGLEAPSPITPFESAAAAVKSLFHIDAEWTSRAYLPGRRIADCTAGIGQKTDQSLRRSSNNDWSSKKGCTESIPQLFKMWRQRFDLFKSQVDMKTLPKQDQHQVMILSMEQECWAAFLELDLFEQTLQPERCDPILQKAEQLVQCKVFDAIPIFVFDANLVPLMAVICTSCQDIDIQRRCIRVLRSVRRREGIWDSQQVADILESMVIGWERNQIAWNMVCWEMPQLAAIVSSHGLPSFKAHREILCLVDEGV